MELSANKAPKLQNDEGVIEILDKLCYTIKKGVNMGNLYSTVQIYDNEKLGRNGFIEKFCKKMADESYVSCGGDEAEQSYILHFAENSYWAAIASEEYPPDGQKARADAVRFAKLLKVFRF